MNALEFASLQILVQNEKSSKLWPKMPHLRIFALEFENTIGIFEISVLKFFCCKILRKNKNA